MQAGNRDVNASHPAAGRSDHAWIIHLEDQRSDSETAGIHFEVAKALGMDPLSNVQETIGAYVRGNAGEDPPRVDRLIDPMQHALLGRYGIDPMRLLHARNLGMGFTVVVVHTDKWWDSSSVDDTMAPRLSGITFMAPGVRHFASGTSKAEVAILETLHGRIPDTVADALIGKPLSHLMKHGLDVDPTMVAVGRLGMQTIIDLRAGDFISIRRE
jgi:hypothetical protein